MQPLNTNELYLSGGGDEYQSLPLDGFFFKKIAPQGRLLYIPVALRGHRLYTTANAWIHNVLTLHGREDIQVDMWDEVPSEHRADLSKYSAVYIGGGNTWNLIKELTELNFLESLKIFHLNGGMIYGGSAGAIVLGKYIDTQDDPNRIGWTVMDGLSFVGNYSFTCHFKEDQIEKNSLWARNRQLPIVCLPEEGGVMVRESVMQCASSVPCFIFLPDGTYRTLVDGEHISLE